MDMGQKITELAETFDPEREADALAVRALIHGAMVGQALHQMRDVIKVHSVEQEKGREGDYLPYFTVVTEAGHRIRVSVEIER